MPQLDARMDERSFIALYLTDGLSDAGLRRVLSSGPDSTESVADERAWFRQVSVAPNLGRSKQD